MVDLKPNLPSYARASHLRWLAGDTRGALEIIRHAIDAGGDPHDREPLAWVLVEAAKIFHHHGDYAGAIAGYDQALAAFPHYAPALAWKARALLAMDRAEEARALAARSYAESALLETAWIWGDAAVAAGKHEEARGAYAKVVRLGRQGERRALALFWATRNERIDEAIALAKEELAGRGDIHTWDAYAWALYRAGRIEEARAAIEKATRLGTKEARLLFHLGAIKLAGGDEDGRKKIGEALALEPGFDPASSAEARRMLDRS
jgi:tetratricopeptide (TPR) repeat protein